MNKSFAKIILVKFLKENKLMGLTILYFYGSPYLKDVDTNFQVLNQHAMIADKAFQRNDINTIKTHLKRMIGGTRAVKTMVRIKGDKLYDIYCLWEHYINRLDDAKLISLYQTSHNTLDNPSSHYSSASNHYNHV